MRTMLGFVVLAMAVAASGCLRKETTHTLYLTPDGSLTWTIIEKDVRSDCQDPARRLAEEQAYLSAASANAHAVGAALSSLRADRLRTVLIRRERPFLAITEAQFAGIDTLAESILAELGLQGRVRLARDGAKSTLLIQIDVAGIDAAVDSVESPVVDLMEDLDRYRIVLTSGTFVQAQGFAIVEEGTQALPIEIPAEQIAESGMIELSLTWKR